MSSPRIPPQIVRLLLLTFGIVVSYGAMRVALRPASFGEYGHYRGAALGELAARTPVFAGARACQECHEDTFTERDQHEHKGISCESCHGPARDHVKDPEKSLAAFPPDGCLRCHSPEPARPATQKQVDPRDHFDGKCVECHLPHKPGEEPP